MSLTDGARARNPILLYPGDNGVHRFYESADSKSFIFRNHGAKHWIVAHEGRCLMDLPLLREIKKERPSVIAVNLSDPTIKGLLAKVKEHFDIAFEISRKKGWIPRKMGNMKLVPCSQYRRLK